MKQVSYINSDLDLDAIFGALADPTRRAILARLMDGEASVGEVAEPFDISQPAISRHLKVLEMAGLIERDRDKQKRPARLNPETLSQAADWLKEFVAFWEQSFGQLDGILSQLKTAKDKGTPNG